MSNRITWRHWATHATAKSLIIISYFQRNHPEFKTSKPDRPLVLAVSPSPQRTEFLRYFTLSHGSQVGGQYFATKLSPSILFYCKYVISQNVKVNQELSEHTHRQQTKQNKKKTFLKVVEFLLKINFLTHLLSFHRHATWPLPAEEDFSAWGEWAKSVQGK